MNPNLIARGIQLKYLFVPESVRTCEIWYGSLFDYPNGFDAQICVLETDFPDEMHPELIRCMGKETPVGCTFLTYHNLKKFQCFDWDNLRQLDENVYDNDRYITTWSQGWRFYTWEHCRNQKTAKPYNKPIGVECFVLFLIYFIKYCVILAPFLCLFLVFLLCVFVLISLHLYFGL